MTRLSLKARLHRFFENNPGHWFAKGALCDKARQATGATGEHTGRRLRELENEGVVEVKHIKNHAHYRLKGDETWEEKNRAQLAWFDSLPHQPPVHGHA